MQQHLCKCVSADCVWACFIIVTLLRAWLLNTARTVTVLLTITEDLSLYIFVFISKSNAKHSAHKNCLTMSSETMSCTAVFISCDYGAV